MLTRLEKHALRIAVANIDAGRTCFKNRHLPQDSNRIDEFNAIDRPLSDAREFLMDVLESQ